MNKPKMDLNKRLDLRGRLYVDEHGNVAPRSSLTRVVDVYLLASAARAYVAMTECSCEHPHRPGRHYDGCPAYGTGSLRAALEAME